MRAFVWAILIVQLGVSCSNIVKISPEFEGVHPEVKKYTNYIHRLGKYKGTVKDDIYNITVGFDDLEGTVVGNCKPTLFPLGTEITLDKTYWKASSEMRRFFLILHEYSHCYFFRRHAEEELEDGCPSSIMYPSTMHEICYKRHFKKYVNEILSN